MDDKDMGADLAKVLISKDEIDAKLLELAERIDRDYAGRDLLIVGVLKGAVMVMADLARALHSQVTMDWMAVSSYGMGTKSSGVVRILKDLDTDIARPGRPDRRGHHRLRPDTVLAARQPGLAPPGLPGGLHAAAQARRGQGRDRRQVRRLRHPQRVRGRLRPGLRGEAAQPAVHRHPGPARLRRLTPRSDHGREQYAVPARWVGGQENRSYRRAPA